MIKLLKTAITVDRDTAIFWIKLDIDGTKYGANVHTADNIHEFTYIEYKELAKYMLNDRYSELYDEIATQWKDLVSNYNNDIPYHPIQVLQNTRSVTNDTI